MIQQVYGFDTVNLPAREIIKTEKSTKAKNTKNAIQRFYAIVHKSTYYRLQKKRFIPVQKRIIC